ncbi:hypothetical protein QBC44DRAFT_97753 [Cladorrhinum sp. PSN332]|nr:hypothetical protein QBC44DRAFT_97753 [Cladorrhinum sp. PSN332]
MDLGDVIGTCRTKLFWTGVGCITDKMLPLEHTSRASFGPGFAYLHCVAKAQREYEDAKYSVPSSILVPAKGRDQNDAGNSTRVASEVGRDMSQKTVLSVQSQANTLNQRLPSPGRRHASGRPNSMSPSSILEHHCIQRAAMEPISSIYPARIIGRSSVSSAIDHAQKANPRDDWKPIIVNAPPYGDVSIHPDQIPPTKYSTKYSFS